MYDLNLEAFEEFDEYRRTSGAKIKQGWTPLAKKKAQSLLRRFPPEIQAKAIEQSIISGWKGLFPEKCQNEANRGNSATRFDAAFSAIRESANSFPISQGGIRDTLDFSIPGRERTAAGDGGMGSNLIAFERRTDKKRHV